MLYVQDATHTLKALFHLRHASLEEVRGAIQQLRKEEAKIKLQIAEWCAIQQCLETLELMNVTTKDARGAIPAGDETTR